MGVLVKQKKIVIMTKGKLALLGGIMGPIDIPYYEDMPNIAKMIVRGYKVYEVLQNNDKKLLDINNYKDSFVNGSEQIVMKSYGTQVLKSNNNRSVNDNSQVKGSGMFHKIVVDARTKEF